MKTTTSCTIDIALLDKAKLLKINVSGLLTDVLRGVISSYIDGDTNILEIEQELNDIEEELRTLKVRHNELTAQKIAFEQKNKTKKDEDLRMLLKKADMMKRSGVMEQ